MAVEPSAEQAAATAQTGPGAGLRVVAAKLRTLAARRQPLHRLLPPLPPRFENAVDALDAMLAIAVAIDGQRTEPTAAAGVGSERARAAADSAVDALFAFLRAEGPALRADIAREPALPAEPDSASGEHRGATFWRLGALIQDVWEHADPEETLIGRDAALLDTLDALGWPDLYDFGAGAGFFAFVAAAHGAEVRCNEANPLKRRFLRFRRAHRRTSTIRLDGGRDRRWAAALAIDVLDHLPDPVAAVHALADRIADDGHLLLQAGFPADGWHRSGDRLVAEVHSALIRRFLPVDAPAALTDRGAMLLRRRAVASDPQTTRAGIRVRLDPAARLRADPDGEGFVLAAPRFYAHALRLSADGARLAEACRNAPRLETLCASLAPEGFAEDAVVEAVEALRDARLLTLEAAR